jgi:hypothetical protein
MPDPSYMDLQNARKLTDRDGARQTVRIDRLPALVGHSHLGRALINGNGSFVLYALSQFRRTLTLPDGKVLK